MSDKIRCPACRGAKKVPKLGGVVGDCNTCNGDGQINACDKPKPVIVEPVKPVNEIIEQVADCLPASEPEPEPIQKKVNGKRAVFKRKKTQG